MERNIVVMAVSAIFLHLAMSLYRPFLQLYFLSIGATIILLGGINSIFSVARGVVQILGGHFADKYGRKILIVVGGLVYASSLLAIYFLVSTWYVALIFFILAQFGIMLYQPATQAMISESVSDKKRATGFATFNLIVSLGGLIAPAIGGYLALGGEGYRILFLIASILLFAVAISRFMFLKETKAMQKSSQTMKQEDNSKLAFIEKIRLTWNSSSSTRAYLIFVFLSSMPYSIAAAYLTPFYLYIIGLDNLQIGLASTACSVATLTFQVPGGKLSDKIGRKRLIMLALIGGPTVNLAVTQARNFIQVLIMEIISGSIIGLSSASSMTLPTELTSQEYRATALGVFRALEQMAKAIGPLIGSLIVLCFPFETYPRYVFYVCVLSSIPAVLIFVAFIKETLLNE